MISRKKIILKSEDLNAKEKLRKNEKPEKEEDFFKDLDDENSWFSLDQLLSDQITEIINKWSQIDDEIWGKIVCFERNRRIAKVYARSQVLSVSGSEGDFDGSRIGLNAFPNFRRDSETESVKKQIKSGFKLKIDEIGNIYIKRVGKCNIYIGTGEDCLAPPGLSASKIPIPTSKSQEMHRKSTFRPLEPNKPEMIFNMRKFLSSITEWTARYPGHKYPPIDFLETFHQKCVHCIQLVRCEAESSRRILRHPCWLVLVNIVGLDLLWSRFGYSNMIMLNQHQLLSLRSCFTFPVNRGAGGSDKYGGHKNSDDLYYSGYMAKISSHHQTRNNTNQSKQHHHHQSSSSSTSFTQIPSFLSPTRSYHGANLAPLSQYNKRFSRSTNHLNFTSANCSTNTSTSEEYHGSTSSLEDAVTSPNFRFFQPKLHRAPKLYKPRNHCDKHYKPPSRSGQNRYLKNSSERLLSMKKLSSSNIELSSGTFYDVNEEMLKESESNDCSTRSEEKPNYGKMKNQKVNASD